MTEKDISKLIHRYKEALDQGKKLYFDADEFDELAEYFDANSDIQLAREVIDTGLTIHPESASLLLKKAKFAIFDGEYTKALNLLNSQTSYDFDSNLIKIECFLQLGLPAEAHELTREILENENTDLDNALAELGFLYVEADYFKEAILYFAKSLEYNSENTDVLSDLSYAHEMLGDYESAIGTTNKVLDIDPYNYEGWINLGKLYSLCDEFEKAVDAFEFALTINDSDEDILKLKAHCLSLCGRVEEAVEIFNNILLNNSEDTSIYFLLAECYESLDMLDEALVYLDEYEQKEGCTVELVSKKTTILLQKGELAAALNIIEKGLERDPQSIEMNMVAGEMKLKLEKFDEAETYLLKAYDSNKDDFQLLDMLAVLNIKKENYQQAIGYTEMMLEIDPDNLMTKQRLALLYFEVDENEQFNALLEQFTDQELLSLFKFVYTPQSDDSFDREQLMAYLNNARECRTLFKNLKY